MTTDAHTFQPAYSDVLPTLERALAPVRRALPSDPKWNEYNLRSVPARARPVLQLICRERGVPDLTGTTVLDLGCGIGTVALFFRLDGGAHHVIGLDVDLGALRLFSELIAATGLDRIWPLYGDMVVPPLQPSSVDVVLLVDNFHYPGLDRAGTLKAAYTLLRPGGLILVKVINGLFPPYALASWPTGRAIATRLWLPRRVRRCVHPQFAEAPRSTTLLAMLRRAGYVAVRVVDGAPNERLRVRPWFVPRVLLVGRRP